MPFFSGDRQLRIKYISANYTVSPNDRYDIILSDTTGGNNTVTFGQKTTYGRNFEVKIIQMVAANTTTINLSGADTFLDGTATQNIDSVNGQININLHVKGVDLTTREWSWVKPGEGETLDGFKDWYPSVKTKTLTTPPGGPSDWDGYMLYNAGPYGGAWVGFTQGDLIYWQDDSSSWLRIAPTIGGNVYVEDEGEGPYGEHYYATALNTWEQAAARWHSKKISAASYTLEEFVNFLLIDNSSNAVAITVPAISVFTANHRTVMQTMSSLYPVTINLSGAETFQEGDATRYLLNAGDTLEIIAAQKETEWLAIQTPFRFYNGDVDTGTETVDTFPDTLADGCIWHYTIKKGANLREGTIQGVWDAAGNTPEHSEVKTNHVGDTSDVTLDVDISSDNVRLRATTLSDDWIVKGARRLT